MGETRTGSQHLYKMRKKRAFKRLLKRFCVVSFAAGIIISISCFIYQHLKPTEARPVKTVYHITEQNPFPKKAAAAQAVDNNDPAIDRYLNSLHFNGSALVMKDNKIMVNKGYGYADLETKLRNNPETVYYIGSITKVFISTCIMQLQEQGRLKITDPLSKYIPHFPRGNQIKLYNLLTHTSGIPEHSETAENISRADLIKKIEKGKLLFQPGTQWNYSDSNYSLLAYIVEAITAEPIELYVKEHIFTIAGMTHTGFGGRFYNEPFISKGYKQVGKEMTSPSLPDMSQLFGCGDIYTTPYDLYRFDKALYTGKLLSRNSLTQFFTPFKHSYALGLYSDPGSYSDHGVLPGWNSLNSFSKDGSIFIVLLSNVQNGVKSLGAVNNQIYVMLRKK